MYEITVNRVFCAAHAIRLEDGALEPLHGHDWQVAVVVAAKQLDQIETVMDFHLLEAQVDAQIDRFHNRCLNEVEPFMAGGLNPTAERVAEWVGQQLVKTLGDPVRLISVSVTEAPGCIATYRPTA